jgi:hypothetical protein
MPSSGLVLDRSPRSLLDDPLDDRRRFLLIPLLIRFRANWENCSSNPLLPRGPLSLLLAWHEKNALGPELQRIVSDSFFRETKSENKGKYVRIFCTSQDIYIKICVRKIPKISIITKIKLKIKN